VVVTDKELAMDRRQFLASAAALAAFPRALLSAAAATAEKRPNIVVILADDLGYECLGANGSTSYKTPVLDALAAKGVRFDRAYAQPLCTPTRVQMMTGIYNVRNYLQFGLMDPQATTFAHLLGKAGYATCMSGKWQLGKDLELPKKFGFDEYCLWQHMRRPGRYRNPGYEINGKQVDYTGGEYGPDIECNYALDFITRHAKKPFFVYWPMVLTHDPYDATPDSPDYGPVGADAGAGQAAKPKGRQGKGNGAKGGGGRGHFADMVAYMDKLVGKLVAHLDRLGLRENTLILFVGDNATGKGVVSRMGETIVHGGKGNPDLTGMHVPMVASWPAGIPGGRVCSDPVDTTDFLPTICQAAGAAVPAELNIDGRSFLATLRGVKDPHREWLYCWYSRQGGSTPQCEFAYDREYVLHRSGKLEKIDSDGRSTAAADDKLAPAAAARKKLQAVLDRYRGARPAGRGKRGPADPPPTASSPRQ